MPRIRALKTCPPPPLKQCGERRGIQFSTWTGFISSPPSTHWFYYRICDLGTLPLSLPILPIYLLSHLPLFLPSISPLSLTVSNLICIAFAQKYFLFLFTLSQHSLLPILQRSWGLFKVLFSMQLHLTPSTKQSRHNPWNTYTTKINYVDTKACVSFSL